MNIVIKQHKQISSQIIKQTRIGNQIISKEKIGCKVLNINTDAVHSINDEKLLFTNYVKSYDKKIYKELKTVIDDIYYSRANIDDRFILMNNEKENIKKIERLNEIIKKSLSIKRVPQLMKFKIIHDSKDKTLEPVRIYVYYNKDTEIFDLYLIDLYHLGIDGYNDNLGRYDLKNRYKINSNWNKCISKIIEDYKENYQ